MRKKTKSLAELTLLCTLYSIEWQNGYQVVLSTDLLPENNATVIPQIITNDADEFYLFLNMYKN
jgi:hypothetical protein